MTPEEQEKDARLAEENACQAGWYACGAAHMANRVWRSPWRRKRLSAKMILDVETIFRLADEAYEHALNVRCSCGRVPRLDYDWILFKNPKKCDVCLRAEELELAEREWHDRWEPTRRGAVAAAARAAVMERPAREFFAALAMAGALKSDSPTGRARGGRRRVVCDED